MLNPNACECECDKLCDVGKFLDYVNCKCRKRVTHKLVKVCTEDIDKIEMAYNASFDFALNKKVCKSRMLNVIVMGISGACLHFHWYIKCIILLTRQWMYYPPCKKKLIYSLSRPLLMCDKVSQAG